MAARALRWLRANDGRCELCGRNRHQFPPGEYLNVDHIHSRKARPDLALAVTNLAVLCSADNAGKGNRYADDCAIRPTPIGTGLQRGPEPGSKTDPPQMESA